MPIQNKSKWLIFAALAALVVILYVYPSIHPEKVVREFGKGTDARSMAMGFLSDAGIEISEGRVRADVFREHNLLAMLQDSAGRRSSLQSLKDGGHASIPAYYWRVQYGNEGYRLPDTENAVMFFQSESDIVVDLTSTGQVFAYVKNKVPADTEAFLQSQLEKFRPEWSDGLAFDSLKAVADLDRELTEIQHLTGSLYAVDLGKDFYHHFNDRFLAKTYWSQWEPFERSISQQQDGSIVVRNRYWVDGLRRATDVRVNFTNYGNVKSVNVNWNYQPSRSDAEWVAGVGAFLTVIGVIVLLIIFMKRYYAKMIDREAAWIDGIIGFSLVLVVMILPSIELMFYNTFITWLPLLGMVGVSLLLAVLNGLLFYVLSGTGASIAREVLPAKFTSFNYVRRGFFFNKPAGRSVLTGMLLGTTVCGTILLFPIVADGMALEFRSSVSKGENLLLMADAATIIGRAMYIFAYVFGIFLTFGLLMYNRNRSWKAYAVFPVLLLMFVNLATPALTKWYIIILMNLVLVAWWLYVFRKFDALTLFITMLSFSIWMLLANKFVSYGWFSGGVILYFLMLSGLLVYGYVAYRKGPDLTELPEFIPEYVLEHARRERVEREYELARKVQQTLLPAETPEIFGMETSARCSPAFEIGGDYFDFIPIDKHKTAIVIGDVSGKGIQAAFYMTLVKGFVRSLCRIYPDPADLLCKVNTLFRENVPRGNFITMIYGIIDSQSGEFTFVRAGHEPLLHRSGQTVTKLQPAGFPLGMAGDNHFKKRIEKQTVSMQPGDALILLTDGFTETRNRKGEFLGDKLLGKALQTDKNLSAPHILDLMSTLIRQFRGDTALHDDVTLIVLVRKPEGMKSHAGT